MKEPTPLDIRHQEFRRAMRGYSEEQVDVFLDEVADEFERILQDNIELRERIQLLDEQVTGYENLKETLNNTLVSAQQQADTTRANVHKEGELILRDAELKARSIVSEAHSDNLIIQQSVIQLRQIEEDFRLKFRSLLEAHINLLGEDEVSEERRRFRDIGTDVERDMLRSLSDDVRASESAEQSSHVSFGVIPAPLESAERLGDVSSEVVMPAPETAVVPAPETDVVPAPEADVVPPAPETGVVPPVPEAEVVPPAPETPVVFAGDAFVIDGDEIDLSGYLPRLPDPEMVSDESAGEASADEDSGDQARGSTVRRFLFGKRDKPESEELFERKDRDFEW